MPTTKPKATADAEQADTPTPETVPERPAPTNVVQALARVMEDLPGIGKDNRSEQGYQYRGIEAITAHAQQLLGRYGVVYVPHVERREVKDLTINGKPWTEDEAWVTYTIYGPGGLEDNIVAGPFVALGRDNSDKGMNKAMTQAYKYALLQTLCIGDHKDDADQDVAREADAPREAVDPGMEARAELSRRLRSLTPEQRDVVRNYCDGHNIPRVPAQFTDDQLAEVEAFADRVELDGPDPTPEQPVLDEQGVSSPTVQEPPADQQEAAEAPEHVPALTDSQVTAELVKRGLPTSGSEATRRKVLAGTLAAEGKA